MPLTKADITRLRALRDKKHRAEQGAFVVEGDKVIAELLAAGFAFTQIYALAGWAAAHPPRADAAAPTVVTAAEMERISHFPTPSPVLAVGRIEARPLPPGALGRGLTLALDGVQDPGNVGTILRIADWFALDRVLLSPDCADLHSQKVINASMGSFARVAVHRGLLPELLATAKVPVLGCDLEGEDLHGVGPVADAVIVIGSEGRGLSPAVAARVTRRVTIPRLGRAESLNAGVAAAIVCDNLRRPAPALR